MINLPLKISRREKKVLLIGGIIVVLIILYHLVTWYRNTMASTDEYLQAKRITLEKQLNKILEKEKIRRKLETVGSELKGLESGLLPSDKPPLAAAEIQRILKQMTASLNIDINLEKTSNPIDNGLYLGIPVEIGFITSTAKLNDLLYMIKTSPLLLKITEIKIRVININNPIDINTSLIVMGFINKSQTEVKNGKSI